MFWKPSSTVQTSTVPPAATTFSTADLLALSTFTVSFRVDLAVSEQLDAALESAFTRPSRRSASASTTVPASNRFSSLTLTTAVLFPEDVDEPALGKPPLQRHLAAFVPGLRPAAAARPEALVPLAGGLPEPGAFAPPDALARAFRPFCGAEIR